VVPALRAHGESDWPRVPAYRLDDFADDLAAIHRALAPGPIALVGHSMVGRIALGYAARHPGALRALALLDSRLGDVDPALAARWRGRVEGGAREGRGHPTREAALAAFRFVPAARGGALPAACRFVPEEPEGARDVVALLARHAIRERAPGDWTFRFDRAVLSL